MIGSQFIADSHEPRDGSAWFWFSARLGAVVAFNFSVGDDFDVDGVAERDEIVLGSADASSGWDDHGCGDEVCEWSAVIGADHVG